MYMFPLQKLYFLIGCLNSRGNIFIMDTWCGFRILAIDFDFVFIRSQWSLSFGVPIDMHSYYNKSEHCLIRGSYLWYYEILCVLIHYTCIVPAYSDAVSIFHLHHKAQWLLCSVCTCRLIFFILCYSKLGISFTQNVRSRGPASP